MSSRGVFFPLSFSSIRSIFRTDGAPRGNQQWSYFLSAFYSSVFNSTSLMYFFSRKAAKCMRVTTAFRLQFRQRSSTGLLPCSSIKPSAQVKRSTLCFSLEQEHYTVLKLLSTPAAGSYYRTSIAFGLNWVFQPMISPSLNIRASDTFSYCSQTLSVFLSSLSHFQ